MERKKLSEMSEIELRHEIQGYKEQMRKAEMNGIYNCLLYTSPSPRDPKTSRMPSSA